MRETYFNHMTIIEEAARLYKETESSREGLVLKIPDKLKEIIRDEAFYCSAQETDMPSRMVLHGASIVSLVSKGNYIDFQNDISLDEQSGPVATRHIPLSFPSPEEPERVLSVFETMDRLSVGEIKINLNSTSSELLENQSNDNGLSEETNFVAFAGLINHIGISERSGLSLAVYEDSDPRFNLNQVAPGVHEP